MTRLVVGVVLCLIAGCLNLSAQTRTSSPEAWEVEFHVGGAFITTPEEAARFIAAEVQRFSKLIKARKITAE